MSTSTDHKKTWLMGGALTALSLGMAMTPAFAQDDAADEDVVVVRGIKRAIQQSIDTKAESTSIVESVSAEDIGKLPDVSIAESLARLPGLAAQRLQGRAQVISVRGLGPDFTTALLNGREQVTAGDNRGVEFDQYPSELLSQVIVYKTPDAQLIGQGLAGTADLRTIRPLDFGRQSITVGARYEVNDQDSLNAGAENDGYRFTGTYVDQFMGDTLGVVFGFATQSTPTQNERFEAWGYPTIDDGAGNQVAIIGGMKPYNETRELKRDAFLGTIEWQPTESFNTDLDIFYSEFEDDGILRGVEVPLFWSGAQFQGIPANEDVSDGIINSGQFNDVQGVLRNDARFREAELFSIGWNGRYERDMWAFEVDASHSSVDRTDTDLELYAGTGAGFGNGASDNPTFTIGSDGIVVLDPELDYSDPSLFLLTDPQGWGQVGFIKQPQTEDELTALRASFERRFDNLGLIDNIELGVNYTTREKVKDSPESFVRGFTGANAGLSAAPVPAEFLLEPTNFELVGIGPMLSFDPVALFESGFFTTEANTNADVITKAWSVEEDVFTAYAQANIIGDIGVIPVRGNVGLQYVSTDQSSSGATPGVDGVSAFTDGDEYEHWLPSLNLSLEIAEDFFVRFGAARALARPRMDDLRASQELGLNSQVCGFEADGVTPFFDQANFNPTDSSGVCFNAGGGNPRLKPYTADSIDISFEKYFYNRQGYVSFALFHKNLNDFIFQGTAQELDYTGVATDIFGADFVAANPDVTFGFVNGPGNVDGGYLRGIEFATNIPGEMFLPSPLDGFGLFASWSVNDSSIEDQNSNTFDIPGFSERVGNISLYYEKNGFEARVSNRYRSDFLGEVVGFGAGLDNRTVQEENVVDAQIGYTFQQGPAEGLSVILQGQNLTDEEFVTIFDNTGLVRDSQQFGRTFFISANYRFR